MADSDPYSEEKKVVGLPLRDTLRRSAELLTQQRKDMTQLHTMIEDLVLRNLELYAELRAEQAALRKQLERMQTRMKRLATARS